MTKLITITITPEDAQKCRGFGDICDCLLATASKRQLGIPETGWISCGSETLSVWDRTAGLNKNVANYAIDPDGNERIHKAYDAEGGVRSLKKSFKVKLTPIK